MEKIAEMGICNIAFEENFVSSLVLELRPSEFVSFNLADVVSLVFLFGFFTDFTVADSALSFLFWLEVEFSREFTMDDLGVSFEGVKALFFVLEENIFFDTLRTDFPLAAFDCLILAGADLEDFFAPVAICPGLDLLETSGVLDGVFELFLTVSDFVSLVLLSWNMVELETTFT